MLFMLDPATSDQNTTFLLATTIIAAIPPTLLALAAFIKSFQNGQDTKKNAEEGKARGEANLATVTAVKSQVDELHGAMVSNGNGTGTGNGNGNSGGHP